MNPCSPHVGVQATLSPSCPPTNAQVASSLENYPVATPLCLSLHKSWGWGAENGREENSCVVEPHGTWPLGHLPHCLVSKLPWIKLHINGAEWLALYFSINMISQSGGYVTGPPPPPSTRVHRTETKAKAWVHRMIRRLRREHKLRR